MPGHYGAAGKKASLGSKYKPMPGKPGSGKMKAKGKKLTKPPFNPTTRPATRGR